ncbi:hypothetical protein [Paenibacillus prosopidis]|uniref:Uncharacterized protein n=1 Tax=Paenibacillus prosopidis TaxID=630520 RepID=A0A368W5W6_9BACL|nr:hypothetical protein [Paenibacillus prosopidis]RCW49664.1 hypothetical protein DFP97_104322 [Paenibacillus prosopidis]
MYFDFGSSNSENAHNFKGAFTSVITGFMGETARVSNLLVADGGRGELTFTMKVDPYLRNYFTVKFSGEESSYIHADGEKQSYKFKPDQNPDNMLAPDLTVSEKQALINGYLQDQVKRN